MIGGFTSGGTGEVREAAYGGGGLPPGRGPTPSKLVSGAQAPLEVCMNRFLFPALALLASAGLVVAAEVKSGLDAGASPAAFNVKDITGPSAGKSLCYRCQYGARPVTVVFTREITEEVGNLVKEIDTKVGENKDKKMAAFVVLLTDDADAGAKQLTKLAEEKKITNTPLTIYDGSAGPEKYKISKDAAVNVMMWNKMRVQVNQAFGAGKLTKEDVSKVAGETRKILE
jgi:hypothetical protein